MAVPVNSHRSENKNVVHREGRIVTFFNGRQTSMLLLVAELAV